MLSLVYLFIFQLVKKYPMKIILILLFFTIVLSSSFDEYLTNCKIDYSSIIYVSSCVQKLLKDPSTKCVKCLKNSNTIADLDNCKIDCLESNLIIDYKTLIISIIFILLFYFYFESRLKQQNIQDLVKKKDKDIDTLEKNLKVLNMNIESVKNLMTQNKIDFEEKLKKENSLIQDLRKEKSNDIQILENKLKELNNKMTEYNEKLNKTENEIILKGK